MRAVRPKILHIQRTAAPQSSLHSETPLVHVRCRQVGVWRSDIEDTRNAACGRRERITERDGVRRRCCAGQDRAERRIAVQKREGVRLIWIVVDPEARTNHRLVGHPVSKADPRCKVLMVGIDKRKSRLRNWRGDHRGLCRIQYGRVSIYGVRNRRKFIAKPKIRSETPGYLPVIYYEKPVAPFGHLVSNLRRRTSHTLCKPKHEVCPDVTRVQRAAAIEGNQP